MEFFVLSGLDAPDNAVEVVERKGLGHPDTICDALAETLSRNLCRAYQERFGQVLHHNVDKALLCGGRAAPAFRGGVVLAPIAVYLAGRATTEIGSQSIDVTEIAVDGSRAWVRDNLHALDADHDIRFHTVIGPGSQDLQELFTRAHQKHAALANDTSVGVGHAPLSALERLVLEAERRINGRDRRANHPAWGEDVKVMGLRCQEKVRITVACAMIGTHLECVEDYLVEKAAIEKLVANLALEQGLAQCQVAVNAADAPSEGKIYLTVTGISAESGDDGQVGRGNRINGLITPCRPMSLEAAAGKNPISHIGKIYNVLADQLAAMVVARIPEIKTADCLIASRIGSPVTCPAVLHVRIATKDGSPADAHKSKVEEVAATCLARLPQLVDDFVAGRITVF
jgi:S-adenosylmethionine synthetase